MAAPPPPSGASLALRAQSPASWEALGSLGQERSTQRTTHCQLPGPVCPRTACTPLLSEQFGPWALGAPQTAHRVCHVLSSVLNQLGLRETRLRAWESHLSPWVCVSMHQTASSSPGPEPRGANTMRYEVVRRQEERRRCCPHSLSGTVITELRVKGLLAGSGGSVFMYPCLFPGNDSNLHRKSVLSDLFCPTLLFITNPL